MRLIKIKHEVENLNDAINTLKSQLSDSKEHAKQLNIMYSESHDRVKELEYELRQCKDRILIADGQTQYFSDENGYHKKKLSEANNKIRELSGKKLNDYVDNNK